MSKRKHKKHLYWYTPHHRQLYKTCCGKYMPEAALTNRPQDVTCKTCRSTVYGREDKSNA